ncbi:MAG: hypothetical protein JKY65_31490 [Planctomycetes bacterium]|nr:hypothetical protein [Planctomycetota bacterium]
MEDSKDPNLTAAFAELVARVSRIEEELALRQSGEDVPASVEHVASEDDERVAAVEARNSQLLADYERIEGEYQALKLQVEMGGGASAERSPDSAQLAELQAKNAQLLAENQRMVGQVQALEQQTGESAAEGAPAEFEQLAALEVETAKLRADLLQSASDQEALLKKLAAAEEAAAKARAPSPSVAELGTLRFQVAKLTTDLETANNALKKASQAQGAGVGGGSGEVAKLREEKEEIKNKATRTIMRLKDEAETVKLQKKNLLRELASRDEGGVNQVEITLEQITNSSVFKTMLGNIRRTSREEVTLLHDSVVELGKIKPDAYNALLVVAAARFKAVNVENPLALLKNLETS